MIKKQFKNSQGYKMTSYQLINRACQKIVPPDLLDIIYGYFCDPNLSLYEKRLMAQQFQEAIPVNVPEMVSIIGSYL
jgi:hypothetical protein